VRWASGSGSWRRGHRFRRQYGVRVLLEGEAYVDKGGDSLHGADILCMVQEVADT
jgi:hypothetical protein